MRTGVLVPAFLGAGIIGVRAVLGKKRAPYPYEYLSWLVVFGGAGMLPDDGHLAEALAWGYLLAMLLAPSFADVLAMFQTAKQTAPPGSGAGSSRSSSSTTTPARVSPHTGTVGG